MKSTKTPGNLRDFRIDERHPGGSEHVPAPSATPPPRQSVKARQNPSLQEWNSSSQTFGNLADLGSDAGENLWTSWERETDESLDLGEPVAAPTPRAPAAARSTPVSAPTRPTASPVAPAPAPRRAAAPAFEPEEENEITPASVAMSGQARSESVAGTVPWAAELALEERRMERSGTVDYTNQYQKQEILKARTREFMALLQKQFREHVELFNESRTSAAHGIHVYRVSKTAEDFMLYRNHVKLVVSGQRAGRILFAFNQYMGQIFAPTQAPVVEIEASWGPFDQLFWSYKGERVQVLDLVRYFLTEFVRQSFR